MSALNQHRSKHEALARVRKHGYTEHFDTGEAGDGGYGSRLYYCRPDPVRNCFGQPLEVATLSRVAGAWYSSVPSLELTP